MVRPTHPPLKAVMIRASTYEALGKISKGIFGKPITGGIKLPNGKVVIEMPSHVYAKVQALNNEDMDEALMMIARGEELP